MTSIIYYCDVSSQDIIHIARLTVPQVLCARDVPEACPRCAPGGFARGVPEICPRCARGLLCARDVPQVCPRCAPDVHRQITELPLLKMCKF